MSTKLAPAPSHRPMVLHSSGTLVVAARGARDLHRYDLKTKSWTKSSVGPVALTSAGVAMVLGTKILFAKGSAAAGPEIQTGILYDLQSNSWQTMPPPKLLPASYDLRITGSCLLFWDSNNSKRTTTTIYDARVNAWSTISTSGKRPPVASKDGRRARSFDYELDYALVPQAHVFGPDRRITMTPETEMVQTSLRLPAYHSFRAYPLELIGTLGPASLLRFGKGTDLLFGHTADGTLARIPGLVENHRPMETRVRAEERQFRLVWTGRKLIAWGGFEVRVQRMELPTNCPPGAPCMPRFSEQSVEHVYNDGLVYAPAVAQWQCLFRAVSSKSGLIGVGLSTRVSKAGRELLISNVVSGSAAEKAGLRPNDSLLAVNGTPLQSASHFQQLIAKLGKGTKVKVSFRRNGKSMTLTTVLGGQARTLSGGGC